MCAKLLAIFSLSFSMTVLSQENTTFKAEILPWYKSQEALSEGQALEIKIKGDESFYSPGYLEVGAVYNNGTVNVRRLDPWSPMYNHDGSIVFFQISKNENDHSAPFYIKLTNENDPERWLYTVEEIRIVEGKEISNSLADQDLFVKYSAVEFSESDQEIVKYTYQVKIPIINKGMYMFKDTYTGETSSVEVTKNVVNP